jgi:hypothetical protein
VPERPVFISPTEGDPVTLSKNLTITYMQGTGTGVHAGAGDGVTGIAGDTEPDSGVYTSLDVSPLRAGPGSLLLTRKFEGTASGTAFQSVHTTYQSSSAITVTWQPTVDEVLAQCPTAEEIALVNAKVALKFDADPSAGTLVCTADAGSANLTRLQERTYQAILMMRRLKFDTPLPWTSKPLFTWFTDNIKEIRYRDDIENSFCCIDVKADPNICALLTNRWGDPETADCGLRDMLVLFVHEARHAEGKPHTCNFVNGIFIHDNTLEELGAWGVQHYLMKWFADHSDPTFLTSSQPSPTYYRDSASHEADVIHKTRICQP